MITKREANYLEYIYNTCHPTEYCSNPPHQYFIDPINYCNLKCVFCIQDDMKRVRDVMSLETFKKIIDSIVDCYGYIPCIDLSRQGEPLMNPNIVEFVRYAKEKGCESLRIQTNANLLTEKISRGLIEAGIDKINFSFGSHNKSIYEKMQPGGRDYLTTVEEIVRFLELRKEYDRPDIECVISTVTYGEYKDTMDKYLEIFSKLPFDKVKVNPFMNWLGKFNPAFEDAMKNTPRKDWPLCKLPWRILAISCDGTACSCNNDWNNLYSIGNINDSSIEEIWNGERMKRFRRSHLERDYESVMPEGEDMCLKCGSMFESPALNGPTYPETFQKGLWDMVESDVIGGGRSIEPTTTKEGQIKKYEYLENNREEWFGLLEL